MRDLQPYIGKVIEAKIIELDKNRNNVVLSRRAWLEETQKEQRGEFLVEPEARRASARASSPRSSTSVPSSTSAAWTGSIHVSELSLEARRPPVLGRRRWATRSTVEVLDVDLDKERISLSLKATQSDPWQEFANTHQVGELVYGRITKLVPFGAFVQVGDGIEGLVHISEMAAHHVDLPEQVVTPGEELWVKIIDIDLQRRRISLSIKQAAEGGEVAEEYREAFGEHAYDAEGNYIGFDYSATDFTPETEARPPGPTSWRPTRPRALWPLSKVRRRQSSKTTADCRRHRRACPGRIRRCRGPRRRRGPGGSCRRTPARRGGRRT